MSSSKSDLERDFAAALYLTENPPLTVTHCTMYIGKWGELVVKKRERYGGNREE
jgi:hypothetical protein